MQSESPTVMTAFNIEAMKLTAMGTTIVVASGDFGASTESGSTCQCSADSSSYEKPTELLFAIFTHFYCAFKGFHSMVLHHWRWIQNEVVVEWNWLLPTVPSDKSICHSCWGHDGS